MMMRHSIPSLTSLRFFAAIIVVLSHFSSIQYGGVAVTFFFMLSGFILTYAHLQIDEDGQRLNVSAKRFIASRAARILPTYFLALVIASPSFFYAHFISQQIGPYQFYF